MDEKLSKELAESRRKYFRDYYSKNKEKYKKSNMEYWKNKEIKKQEHTTPD